MTISTYSELQDSIGNWLDRSSVYGSSGTSVARTKEWISLTEARINRLIRERQMVTRAQASVDSEYSALPDNFGGVQSVRFSGGSSRPLVYHSPNDIEKRKGAATSGTPRMFTIEANQFRWLPVPDDTYSLEILYYKRVPSLSDSATTNWFLTDHPDVYLAGCLVRAWGYLENADKALLWDGDFNRGLEEVFEIDGFNRYPQGMLSVKPNFAIY